MKKLLLPALVILTLGGCATPPPSDHTLRRLWVDKEEVKRDHATLQKDHATCELQSKQRTSSGMTSIVTSVLFPPLGLIVAAAEGGNNLSTMMNDMTLCMRAKGWEKRNPGDNPFYTGPERRKPQ